MSMFANTRRHRTMCQAKTALSHRLVLLSSTQSCSVSVKSAYSRTQLLTQIQDGNAKGALHTCRRANKEVGGACPVSNKPASLGDALLCCACCVGHCNTQDTISPLVATSGKHRTLGTGTDKQIGYLVVTNTVLYMPFGAPYNTIA